MKLTVNSNSNLPPGCTNSDIERNANGTCEECSAILKTDEEIRMGLCNFHLKEWEENTEEKWNMDY